MISGIYFKKIITEIIANTQCGITEVLDLESIKTTYFDSAEYPNISQLIKNGDVSKIREWATNKSKGTEYLDILLFKDQDRREYIVSIYDNEELWHDPEVIEISLKSSI